MANTTVLRNRKKKKHLLPEFISLQVLVRSLSTRRDMDEYFGLDTLKVIVKQPLVATGTEGKLTLSLTYVVVVSQVRLELSDMVFQEHYLRLMLSTDQSLRRLDTLQEIQV